MDVFTNGTFPRKLAAVKTVVLYSENVTTTVNASLTQSVTSMFDKIKVFNELIVVEMVPDIYLHGLNSTRSRTKYLALYSYLGDFFNRPCDLFPELKELTLDITGMSGMDLTSCQRLEKLSIRGYYASSDSVSVLIFAINAKKN